MTDKEWILSLISKLPAAMAPLATLAISLASESDITGMANDLRKVMAAHQSGDSETVESIASRYGIARALIAETFPAGSTV